ncbi:InlB B-repeat-containing protein, partial [Candidatus Saccharibacteria bacterium]|nr:InlB B-repeat-containing protein [Candidatus Saccharibacteria bacterium]
IATSNVSGYKLMMNSDYRTDGTSSDTPSAAEFTTSLINTDSTIAATEVGQISTSAGSSTASSTSYWNYSKSWNESLGPEGQTKSFSSTTLADTINPSTNQPYGNTILENLAIPAKATPDTVRDDVDIATSSSQTSVSINVNAATDKSSGIYKNELVFTAIANPIPVDYTLTFDKNTSDAVANLPDPLTATTIATSYTFTIPDVSGQGALPEMVRSGYQFAGWSTDPSTRQGSGSGPDGLYVAGDTYTVIADDSGNPDYTTHGTGSATLYAVWALEYIYTLNYSCGTGATNCPTTQTATTINTSHTFTIPSTAPSLDGYNFINYTDNGAGAGNTYNPGDTVTLTSTSNTKILTANFEQNGPASFTAGGYTWTANVQGRGGLSTANSTCNSLSPGTWSVPTQAQYNSLISTSAGKAAAYDHWGVSAFWSSTYLVNNLYYVLNVYSATSADINNSYDFYYNTQSIVCVRS